MNFRQFAFKNVVRNKRLYVAYFLSSLFTVMVFFTFAMFAFHPAFMEGAIKWQALYGMVVAGGIIYVFSFFFVLYSMSSFLRSRKKEFGLLMMQGMSTRQIRLMVFMENMLIGLVATVGGILLGIVFSKAILLLAENVLVIDQSLNFYVPLLAIAITFVSFLVLFLFISLFVSFILRTRKLIDLIKGSKQSEGEPKASVLLSVIAAILLIAGYGIALYVKGTGVIVAMIPVIAVVVVGTYLLFTQLSVFIIHRLKRKKGIFWRKTNMLLFSDLSFRMKDNARTFFMVAIISTVAFSAIGTLFGFQSYITKGVKDISPFTFIYNAYPDDEEDNVNKDIDLINSKLDEYGVRTDSDSINMSYYEQNDERVLIVSETTYNTFGSLLDEDEITLADDEAITVKDSDQVLGYENRTEKRKDTPITLKDGSEVMPDDRVMNSSVLPEMFAYYIVSDAMYDKLPEPISTDTSVVWMANETNKDDVIAVGEAIIDEIGYGNFQAFDYNIYEINKSFGPIMFIGLFIGIVFFVSAGSFLYFRLYTDLDEDKEKFKNISKMGLTSKELKKVVNRQTALLFFAPIVVALVHGAVALTALSHFFEYNLVYEASLVLGGFAVIQIVYFVIVRYFYTKQIQKVI